MSAKSNNIRIGVFVLIAVALFVLGLLAFGAQSYFQPKTRFETLVAGDVAGLSVGSPVQLRGVPVGKVSKIDFVWNVYPASTSKGIIVDFELQGDIVPQMDHKSKPEVIALAVDHGLRAVVKGQGITGTSLLSLETLDAESNPKPQLDYQPRAIFIPSAPGQFTRMLDAVSRSLENIQKVNFDAIGDGITNALQSITRLSDRLGTFDVATLSTNANETVLEVHRVSQKLQLVLDQVNAVPMVQTVSDVQQAVRTLNEVLNKLDSYPSGFIFGEPPLPAQSVQPAVK